MSCIPLTQEAIDKVFAEAPHQLDYVIGLYKISYPVIWEQIERVKNWPKVSKRTAEYVYKKAIAFDKEHHPKVFAGGAWLNNGFSRDENLKDWVVVPAEVVLK